MNNNPDLQVRAYVLWNRFFLYENDFLQPIGSEPDKDLGPKGSLNTKPIN